jgi:hypothetical protein
MLKSQECVSGNCRVFIAAIEYVRPSDQRKTCFITHEAVSEVKCQ